MKFYTLFDSIASGGMGTVHYARAIGGSGLSRVVAIKRMHGDLARDPICLSMFKDELRLATRVRHPNVVATVDMVEQDDELLLVMEYVQGESLQDLIARTGLAGKRIPPAIAVAIAIGILQGLEAAHDAKSEAGEPLGIVHRDVSPENILVGRDGVARLLDFGIARGAGRKYVTRVGEIKGKPSYLAPEQILDGGQHIDRRADIYGVAIVLWEALTGQRLFDGDSPTATLSQVLTGEVAPPSKFVGALPSGLDEIVLRGLRRDPDARYRTALEMARALGAVSRTPLSFEVGEWVLATAADSLARQAELVARLERAVLTPVPAALTPVPASLTPVPMTLTPVSTTPRPSWLELAPRAQRGLLAAAMTTVCFTAGVLLVSAATAHSHPAASALALPIAAISPPKSPPATLAPPAVTAPPLSSAAPPKAKKKHTPVPPHAAHRLPIDDGF